MEGKAIVKWAIFGFLALYLLSGLSLAIFAVTVPTPFGDYLTMKAEAFPINYGLRIGLVLLLLITTGLSFFAAAKENNKLLTMMAVFFIIFFLVELILGIIYLTMRSEVSLGQRKFSSGLQMLNEYGIDEKVTETMDKIQRTNACCGVMDYRDWFTSKWAAVQGKSNRVPTSCCKFPTPTCGDNMDTKNPTDVINILGCTGLNYSYDYKEKVIGGVGLAIGFLNLFALLCCIIFCFCFNAVRGLSTMDALKGEEPSDEPRSAPDPRRSSSPRHGTPGSSRPQSGKPHYTSKQRPDEESEDDNDLPPDASKDLLDKSVQ